MFIIKCIDFGLKNEGDWYQRETITQVINEYEDLAGIGITMGLQGLGSLWENEWRTSAVNKCLFTHLI